MTMPPRRVLLLVAAFLASACVDRYAARRPGDTSHIAFEQPETVITVPSGEFPCGSVRALTEQALHIQLMRDTSQVFDGPGDQGKWAGCRYTGHFFVPKGADSLPDQQIDAAMRGARWNPDESFAAVSAGEKDFAYAGGIQVCHYSLVTPAEKVSRDTLADTTSSDRIEYVLQLRCTSSVDRGPT